ncbi:PIG-L deacetylase family protein [uncultured Deinococcus sp.]|uniref:PIG-L deacetylase family protein n=1 Tax=uncultured Deinococcus sp. TaxID=158789 RepID=UPI002588125D|nr:PIG-L deacetylase family protein [uncultured Deinococcus sp.]
MLGTPGVGLFPLSQPLDPLALPGPVWVAAPHPDDEALGCGALLAALTAAGREVWALLLTDGGFSHPGSREFPRSRLAAEREREWRAGLAELGVLPGRTRALGLPDGALARCDPAEVGRLARAAFAAAPPATLLLPWRRDPHPDHRAAWGPLTAACAGARVLGYAVWLAERGAGTDWPAPAEARAWSLEVGGHHAAKARAVAAHATQLGRVTDDPGGFTLAPEMVRRALAGPELYFEESTP